MLAALPFASYRQVAQFKMLPRATGELQAMQARLAVRAHDEPQFEFKSDETKWGWLAMQALKAMPARLAMRAHEEPT